GVLDAILERLSVYLESDEELKGQVKGDMVYPVVICGVATAVTLFLLIAVIPTLKTVFASFGSELPLPTRILLMVSDFLRHNFMYLLAIPIAMGIALKRWYKTEKGLTVVDGFVIKLPVLGDLLTKVAVSKFTRTLGTLI